MNLLKEEIINQLLQSATMPLDDKFATYKQQYPNDVDMYLLEGYWFLLKNNVSDSLRLLLLSRKHNPYNVDTYFLLGDLYLLTSDFYSAMENFSYAHALNISLQDNHLFYSEENYSENFTKAQQMLADHIMNINSPSSIKFHQAKLQDIERRIQNNFDLYDLTLLNTKNQIGETLFSIADGERFCGYADLMDPIFFKFTSPKSLTFFKGELLKIVYEGTSFSPNLDGTMFVPIAFRESDNRITVCANDGNSLNIQQVRENHFNYYRMEGRSQISSEHTMLIGAPILLGHKPPRRKLVISFFVDGLSQKLLQEEGLGQLMPNTYQFFSKGLICENFFVTSDWTYPSLPSFISGTTLPNHMMFHPGIKRPLPTDQKIVFEHLKDAGYYTAAINSDPQFDLTLGYTRGIDRYITQHPCRLRGKYVITDALEHISAFHETDQYLWINYADLHDIADAANLPVSIQTQQDYTLRKEEPRAMNSIIQYHSPLKRSAYIQALKTADTHFHALYAYLEQNYSEDEFIITLFGDHGQTYLLHPEEHHLARYHSNAAFMIRGGGCHGISQEYISSVDYPYILCQLAGIPSTPDAPEGQLPKTFGGKTERDLTITETIHPDEPYQAAIHTKTHTFYLTTHNNITHYGRLNWGTFESKLINSDGEVFSSPELMEFYIKLIKNRLKHIIEY